MSRFVTAKERGITEGSRVHGVFKLWGSEIPFTATVIKIHPAVVTVRYDEPFEAEGPYVGEWREYKGGGYFPEDLTPVQQ